MDTAPAKSIRKQAIGLIFGLAVQYALGMYVDLFVEFPEGADKGQLWQFAWSQIPLAAHIILGILIVLGAIALCVRAARSRNKTWIWASAVGLVAVLFAWGSGASFIPSQTDLYSYSMALSFIVAIMAYVWGLYADRTLRP